MKKKLLAVVLSLIMVFAFVACGTSDSGDNGEGATYNWQIGNVLSAGQPWDMGLVKFAELMNQYSDGRITATVQSGGTLGSEIEMLEAVQMGTLEFSIASTPSYSGFCDALNYFDLPYLFQTTDSAWKVMDEWLSADRQTAMKGSGFHLLGFFDNGEYMIAGNKKFNAPADAKGLRVRSHSSQLQCDTLSALGANPLAVAWGDIYVSLQQGTIDAVSGTTLTNMYGGKFYEQTDYINMTKQHFIPAPVSINEDLWESLSAEDQEIVTRSFQEAMEYQRGVAVEYANEAKQAMVDYGVEIVEIDPAEWSAATASVYDKWVGTNGIENDMITKIKESEKTYLQ